MVRPRSQAGRGDDRPRAAIARSAQRAGYVLIEVAAALAVAGMVTGLALSNVGHGTTPGGLVALTSASVALLRDARTSSGARNVPVAATFDPRRRKLSAGPQVLLIPADVELTIVAGGNCPIEGPRSQILFRPDGTNCGGILRFAKGRLVYRTRVNWVDGQIDVVEGG